MFVLFAERSVNIRKLMFPAVSRHFVVIAAHTSLNIPNTLLMKQSHRLARVIIVRNVITGLVNQMKQNTNGITVLASIVMQIFPKTLFVSTNGITVRA